MLNEFQITVHDFTNNIQYKRLDRFLKIRRNKFRHIWVFMGIILNNYYR